MKCIQLKQKLLSNKEICIIKWISLQMWISWSKKHSKLFLK